MRRAILTCGVAALLLTGASDAGGDTRLKDITHRQGEYSVPLIGYGLVVGLDGTGDRKNTYFTQRSLVNMLQRMGVTVDADKVKVKNVAAVMITGRITPLHKPGGRLDVTVSSVGDATSLQGGMLLMTPLSGPDGVAYATAQGPVTIGGFNVQAGGNQISNNYTMVGRIPNGALITAVPPHLEVDPGHVQLTLRNPDITTATRIVTAINQRFGDVASALDAATVEVVMPPDHDAAMSFMARLEAVTVEPDIKARVVLNERTGTIVFGQHVTVAPVAMAHGALTVEITRSPVIVQPMPFSRSGETARDNQYDIAVQEEAAKVVAFQEVASVGDIAAALNAVGATPRDVIAVFQALRQAGALRAELIIM
jgi:flagellar P-ring protein precursor FlgI